MPVNRVPVPVDHSIQFNKPPIFVNKNKPVMSNPAERYNPIGWEEYFDRMEYTDDVIFFNRKPLQF